jgi:hypothetical protein
VTDPAFRDLLVEAIAGIRVLGVSIEDALDRRVPTTLSRARSLGFLEGAAAALDVTVVELLDQFDLL